MCACKTLWVFRRRSNEAFIQRSVPHLDLKSFRISPKTALMVTAVLMMIEQMWHTLC